MAKDREKERSFENGNDRQDEISILSRIKNRNAKPVKQEGVQRYANDAESCLGCLCDCLISA
jgi:hypothetical protein